MNVCRLIRLAVSMSSFRTAGNRYQSNIDSTAWQQHQSYRMVTYSWHGDERYYATVVDRYYRQAWLPLRLKVQAFGVWIVASAFILFSDLDLVMRCVWLAVLTAFSLAFPYIVKRGIVMKYRSRSTFGAETTFKMTDTEVLITGPGAGHFSWTIYDRAVSFSDGLLLLRKGGIRWLPHEALREGTPAEAVALVQSHLPLRLLAQ